MTDIRKAALDETTGGAPRRSDGQPPFPAWAWTVPLLALLPFLALLAQTFPQRDDFCFGSAWQELGLVAMLEDFYRTFVGRLFANTVIVVPFMVQDWVGADLLSTYRILCGAVLLGTIALAYAVTRILLPDLGARQRLLVWLVLAAALVGGSPSPENLYFWFSQVANYTLVAAASLAIMIWLWRTAERATVIGPLGIAALALAGFAIAMATEMSGLILFAIVFGAWIRRCLHPRAQLQALGHALVLAAIAAGAIVVAAAPGNSARMEAYGQSRRLIAIIANAVLAGPVAGFQLTKFLALSVLSPAFLAWPIVLALVVWHCDRRSAPAPRWPVVWLPLATALVAIGASFWVGQLGMGQMLPPRARNHLHFVLIGGIALTTVEATRAYGDQVRDWAMRTWPAVTGRRLAFVAVALTILTPNVLVASWSLLTQPLRPALADRFASLDASRGSNAELAVPPLPAGVTVIGDITRDPTLWPNTCLARYYGLRSIILSEPSPQIR